MADNHGGRGSSETFDLTPYLKAWGACFRRARKQRGLSQTDVARLIGISPSSISRFEAGEEPLGPEPLIHYTRLLGLPAWLLLVEQPQSETTQLLLRVAAAPTIIQESISGFLTAIEKVEDTSSKYSLLGVNY